MHPRFLHKLLCLVCSLEGVHFVALVVRSGLRHRRRKGCRFILAFCWLAGLICGIFIYLSSANSLTSMMRSVLYAPVSIVGLLCVTVLPFLLSAFAVFFFRPVWLLPICFAKAFLFAFISMGIVQDFGSAGWLIRCLLLFSDCIGVPILYWFWMRCLSDDRRLSGWELTWIFSLVLLVGSVNKSIISPVLAHLIEI